MKTNVAPKQRYLLKAILSFLLVLLLMPLGHAFMIIMERLQLPHSALYFATFIMGLVGLFMVIWGVFAKGDTTQTLWGLIGGLFFWTGWVEFLFQYYANRYGVMPEIDPITHKVITKPEYLIMPATFGLWAMVMVMYIFSAKTGCKFFNWIQKRFFGHRKKQIVLKPMTHHSSIVTFMELIMILWTSYLLLMFCYDPRFIGDHNIITYLVGLGCFISSIFMFIKQTKIKSWGQNIRFSIATVIVFWTPIEILGRTNLIREFWISPSQHKTEMIIILLTFCLLLAYFIWKATRRTKIK